MIEQTVAETAVAPLVGSLPPQCQRDVDTLRRFVHTTISQGSPADPVSPADFREVLLTGATGFIGRFLLRDLLQQNDDLVVHCVVRADDADHGLERLRDTLRHAEIWDEAFTPRIRVVAGDIGQARFGLSGADFNELCQRIDAVYHLAADISLATSYEAIRRLNTLSLHNVLELCLRKRFKHLFYASTMAVFPQYFFAFANEFRHRGIDHHMQPDLDSMKETYPLGLLGYPWSKLTSEQVLLFAQQAGMPLAIFRLPQTAVSSSGYIQPNDLTMQMLAAVIDCESIPEGFTFRSNNEAVDTVSQACTAISLNPDRRFTIYHCCKPRLDYYELELADFGIYLPEVPFESFKRACQARGEKSPLHGRWALLDHFGKYWFSKEKPDDRMPICDRAFREDCPHPIKWAGVLTKLRRSYQLGRVDNQHWPYPESQGRLDFDRLIARAERYAEDYNVSFEQTYPPWMLRNLQQLVQAFQSSDAKMLDNKIYDIVFDLSRLLIINAGFSRERQRYPEIEREKITRPVFIVGINRTGTTYLHRLMSRDQRFWALQGYEFTAPRLSKEEYASIGCTPGDPRRAWIEDLLNSSEALDLFEGVHDFDVDEPSEDFPILSAAFGSWTLIVRFRIPDYGRWLAATGTRHAYAHHRRTMQNITWQRRQRQPEHQGQWLLKMPFHLMELETLVETYPDALFIQTHREPTQFMGSWNSLIELVRSIVYEPQPRDAFGAEQLAIMSDMMDRAVQFRQAHPELEHRWMDVNYIDLVEKPMETVASIYERFDWPLEQTEVKSMEDWQVQQAQKRRGEKRHRYDLGDYGLTPEQVNAAFARYRDFLTDRGIRSSSS